MSLELRRCLDYWFDPYISLEPHIVDNHWWHGPLWLSQGGSNWPQENKAITSTLEGGSEKKVSRVNVLVVKNIQKQVASIICLMQVDI